MRVIKSDIMGATEIDIDFDAFMDDSGISWTVIASMTTTMFGSMTKGLLPQA